MYTIDGRQDGAIKESWTTNNRTIAEAYAEIYVERYGSALISKLERIEHGVAVYKPMKEYGLWTGV
jgi:hypothetical protein